MELALFLIIAIPASILMGWHFPADWFNRPAPTYYISDTNTILRLMQIEVVWHSIRQSKQRVRHLPAVEQAFVMTCTDFEFDWFLVQLWGEAGEFYRTLKLEQSMYRTAILEAEQQLDNNKPQKG